LLRRLTRLCHAAPFGKPDRASHLHSIEREVRMTRTLVWSVVALAVLALGACAEDSQTTERGIDQDITATHRAGAPTIDNLGQNFAPWRFNMTP